MSEYKKTVISVPIEYWHFNKGDIVFANGSNTVGLDIEMIYEVESFEPPTTPESKGFVKLHGRLSKVEAQIFEANENGINYKEQSMEVKGYYKKLVEKIKQDKRTK